MDDLRFMSLFNSISVISGRRKGGNEKLCAMELLRLKRFPSTADLEPKAAISTGQRSATEPLDLLDIRMKLNLTSLLAEFP